MKEYIEFREVPIEGRKTKIVGVYSLSSGALLGEIKWYGAWRQYCFFPRNAIFNKDCLEIILAKINEMMHERKSQ